MSTDQWEQGPLFTSRRAMTGLAITEGYLYALGGDANGGGGWVDATDYVERLDLSQWPGGAWTNINDPSAVTGDKARWFLFGSLDRGRNLVGGRFKHT